MRSSRCWNAALVLFGIGCGIDQAQFTQVVCDTSDFDLVRHVVPAEPVDYLELRSAALDSEWMMRDAIGTACAGASDREACASELALPNEIVALGDFALASTRGDLVLVEPLSNRNGPISFADTSTAALLGPVDSPGDAALVVLGEFDPQQGRSLRCDAPGQVGEHPEGFVVYTRSTTPCDRRDEVRDQTLLVRIDGTTEILEEEIVHAGVGGCEVLN